MGCLSFVCLSHFGLAISASRCSPYHAPNVHPDPPDLHPEQDEAGTVEDEEEQDSDEEGPGLRNLLGATPSKKKQDPKT